MSNPDLPASRKSAFIKKIIPLSILVGGLVAFFVLDLHRIKGTAVGVDADEVIVFFFKAVEWV